MNFKDLYSIVVSGPHTPVTFEFLRQTIIQNHPDIQDIKVWRLSHKRSTKQAYFTLFDDRTSAYGGEFLVADISYCQSLEGDPAELFFALCKELMHVFDPRETWIDDKKKFVEFLKDLQNLPLDSRNGPLESERHARWMALIILCPKPVRDQFALEIGEGRALRSEVAERLGLPERMIEVALDSYYDTALGLLTQ
jgi:hypothetical protein